MRSRRSRLSAHGSVRIAARVAVLALLAVAPVVVRGQAPPEAPAISRAVLRQALWYAVIPVSGAMGTQLIQSPTAWPRTWGGYGQRVADQAGFLVVEEGMRHFMTHQLGWHAESGRCADDPLRCGVRRTFTLQDAAGRRRTNLPLLASVASATAVSLAWRPERKAAPKARGFVATRLAVSFGATATANVVTAWWGQRSTP